MLLCATTKSCTCEPGRNGLTDRLGNDDRDRALARTARIEDALDLGSQQAAVVDGHFINRAVKTAGQIIPARPDGRRGGKLVGVPRGSGGISHSIHVKHDGEARFGHGHVVEIRVGDTGDGIHFVHVIFGEKQGALAAIFAIGPVDAEPIALSAKAEKFGVGVGREGDGAGAPALNPCFNGEALQLQIGGIADLDGGQGVGERKGGSHFTDRVARAVDQGAVVPSDAVQGIAFRLPPTDQTRGRRVAAQTGPGRCHQQTRSGQSNNHHHSNGIREDFEF